MSKILCTNCGDVVESKHRHDWVSCRCYGTSAHKETEFSNTLRFYLEESTESKTIDTILHLACCAFNATMHTGVFVDGGDEYMRIGGNMSHYKVVKEETHD